MESVLVLESNQFNILFGEVRMIKKRMVVGIIVILAFMGCNDSDHLKIAYDVKAKKNLYSDTVALLKTEGDFLAGQINRKVKLFAEKPEGALNRSDSEEIIKLQNTLIQMQTRKIEEQEKYIKELEGVICQLVDPKKEVIGTE